MADQAKIAILISAHTDFAHLQRLISSLDDPRFDIYVHIDAKSGGGVHHEIGAHAQHAKVHLIPQRKVFWGDLSLVLAILDLYRTAYSLSCGSYCRYVTLSGLDYPIVSNDELYRRLSDDSIEYVAGYPLSGDGLFFKISTLHWMRLPRILRGTMRVAASTLGIRNGKRLVVDGKEITSFYFGVNWMAISGDATAYLLDALDNNPDILKFFKHTYAPDELLVPTLLLNNDAVRGKAVRVLDNPGKHYNEWPTIHYLNYEPVIEVYDEKSYDKIVASDKMFVRKVKTGFSDKLLDMLDEHRSGARRAEACL